MNLVFLGGTVANNNWREAFVESLAIRGVPTNIFFNPVVKGWTVEARQREEEAKKAATHLVFYLADTKQDGNPLKAMNQSFDVLKARFPEANIFGTRDEAVDWLAAELVR